MLNQSIKYYKENFLKFSFTDGKKIDTLKFLLKTTEVADCIIPFNVKGLCENTDELWYIDSYIHLEKDKLVYKWVCAENFFSSLYLFTYVNNKYKEFFYFGDADWDKFMKKRQNIFQGYVFMYMFGHSNTYK